MEAKDKGPSDQYLEDILVVSCRFQMACTVQAAAYVENGLYFQSKSTVSDQP